MTSIATCRLDLRHVEECREEVKIYKPKFEAHDKNYVESAHVTPAKEVTIDQFVPE
jgi:hypothetical protein